MCGFVHDVFAGLANLVRRLVNNVFFMPHHYLDTTAPMTNSRLFAPRGSTTTTSTPVTLTRYRPWRLLQGYLDHGVSCRATSTTATPPYALGYLDISIKGYHLA